MKGGTKILTPEEQGILKTAARFLPDALTRIVWRSRAKCTSGPANLVFNAATMQGYSAAELRDLLKGHTTYKVRDGKR